MRKKQLVTKGVRRGVGGGVQSFRAAINEKSQNPHTQNRRICGTQNRLRIYRLCHPPAQRVVGGGFKLAVRTRHLGAVIDHLLMLG